MKKRIPLIALVDVVFLLLIFFLLNSFISTQRSPRIGFIKLISPEREGNGLQCHTVHRRGCQALPAGPVR